MTRTEILSQFLNGEINREQLQSAINKTEPLIFEVEVETPQSNPKIDATGFYEKDGTKVFQSYDWYLQQDRDIKICIHSIQ